MASAPTNINAGITATSHASNSYAGQYFGGLVGAVPIQLSAGTVPASQAGVVWCQTQMPFKARYRAVTYSGQATTGTASFDVNNTTASGTILASTTVPNGSQGASTTLGTATEIINKSDVIQLRVTTAGASSVTELVVWLWVSPLGEADNPLPNASYTS